MSNTEGFHPKPGDKCARRGPALSHATAVGMRSTRGRFPPQPITNPVQEFDISQRLWTNQIPARVEAWGAASDGPGNSGKHVSLGKWAEDGTATTRSQEAGEGALAIRRSCAADGLSGPRIIGTRKNGTSEGSLLHDGPRPCPFETQVPIRRGGIGARET